jgi:hypothetical protein
MSKKNGVQGSYNSSNSTPSLVVQLREERKRWIREYVQYLKYNPTEMEKWKRFAGQSSN